MNAPAKIASTVTRLPRRWRLIDGKTGEEIALPATRKCWDGYEITIKDFRASGSRGMEGLILTTMNEEYVPSVCGAKIIEFPVGEAALEMAGCGGIK